MYCTYCFSSPFPPLFILYVWLWVQEGFFPHFGSKINEKLSSQFLTVFPFVNSGSFLFSNLNFCLPQFLDYHSCYTCFKNWYEFEVLQPRTSVYKIFSIIGTATEWQVTIRNLNKNIFSELLSNKSNTVINNVGMNPGKRIRDFPPPLPLLEVSHSSLKHLSTQKQWPTNLI